MPRLFFFICFGEFFQRNEQHAVMVRVHTKMNGIFFPKEGSFMSLKTAFSREVLHARTSLGLTQEQVAEAASISVRWYQYIESGTFLPSSVVTLPLSWPETSPLWAEKLKMRYIIRSAGRKESGFSRYRSSFFKNSRKYFINYYMNKIMKYRPT